MNRIDFSVTHSLNSLIFRGWTVSKSYSCLRYCVITLHTVETVMKQ